MLLVIVGGAAIRLIITDLNDTYPDDFCDILAGEGICDTCVRISLKDIDGRNMYCDDEAYRIIRDRLSKTDDPTSGLHLTDTGNYHYMSRIFTSFIGECYDLLLIDHHTDMQEASFGGLLSCGSWAREVLEKDPHLGKLTVIGPEKFEDGGEEVRICAGSRELTGRMYKGKGYTDELLPLYISVDKDVMSTDECITNWDQGDLSLEDLRSLIRSYAEGRTLIGADICGGLSANDPGYDPQACTKNLSSDIELIKFFKEITES